MYDKWKTTNPADETLGSKEQRMAVSLPPRLAHLTPAMIDTEWFEQAVEKIKQLEAENRALLSQLMTARAQLESVLATMRQAYDSVRNAQANEHEDWSGQS